MAVLAILAVQNLIPQITTTTSHDHLVHRKQHSPSSSTMKTNLISQEITSSKIPIPYQTLHSATKDLELMIVAHQLDTVKSIHCLPYPLSIFYIIHIIIHVRKLIKSSKKVFFTQSIEKLLTASKITNLLTPISDQRPCEPHYPMIQNTGKISVKNDLSNDPIVGSQFDLSVGGIRPIPEKIPLIAGI